MLANATPTEFNGAQIVHVGGSYNLTTKYGTIYAFDSTGGWLTSIKDRNGNQVTIGRNSSTGIITQVTSPSGLWIQFTYDSSNRITQVQDNIGRTVSYAYDGGGRLQTVTDAKSGVTTFTYDSSSDMLTIQNPRSIIYLTTQ